jgi:hypothetical protein
LTVFICLCASNIDAMRAGGAAFIVQVDGGSK